MTTWPHTYLENVTDLEQEVTITRHPMVPPASHIELIRMRDNVQHLIDLVKRRIQFTLVEQDQDVLNLQAVLDELDRIENEIIRGGSIRSVSIPVLNTYHI